VGSIGTTLQEYKSTFSNSGPRVDIWAPGSEIQSSVNSATSYGGNPDPRNNTFYLAKISGTSMASPQVCGVLACALETYPWMDQFDAREYLFNYTKSNQVGNTGGGFTDQTSLQGANDRYLFKFNERPESGQLYPKKNYWLRDRNYYSKIWPRPKVRIYK
jgi:subtilisin family serine protease